MSLEKRKTSSDGHKKRISSVVPHVEKQRRQQKVTKIRNRFMHENGEGV